MENNSDFKELRFVGLPILIEEQSLKLFYKQYYTSVSNRMTMRDCKSSLIIKKKKKDVHPSKMMVSIFKPSTVIWTTNEHLNPFIHMSSIVQTILHDKRNDHKIKKLPKNAN